MSESDDDDDRWQRQQAAADARRNGPTPWAQLATDLGLEPAESGTVALLRGTIKGASVKITRTTQPAARRSADREAHWTIGIKHPDIHRGLKLTAEGKLSGIRRALGRDDILTGDDPFDRRVKVGGDSAVALAVLGESTRALLSELLDVGLRVAESKLEVEVTDRANLDVWRRRIQQLLTFACRLAETDDDITALLLRNARADGVAAVRRANLRAALQRAPQAVAGIADALLKDSDPTVRALVALSLGDAAIAELDAYVQGPDTDEDVFERALRQLADRPPLDARSEGALLQLLKHDVGDRVAIIEALGKVGTHDAIRPLLEAGRRVLARRPVRVAVTKALDAIQARHGPAAGGRLSLSDGGRIGALSKVLRGGRLSRSDDSDATE